MSFCAENKILTLKLALLTLVIAGLAVFKQWENNKNYIINSQGEVTGIHNVNGEENLSLPLRIEARKDKVVAEEEVIFSLGEECKEKKIEKAPSSDDLLKDAVKSMVKDLEKSGEKRILLPKKLEDGTVLIWKKQKEYTVFFTLLILPLGLWFMYRKEKEKIATRRSQREGQIKLFLPAFNNQLLLLLGSGLIFHDAFVSIVKGYEGRDKNHALGELLLSVKTQWQDTGNSLIKILEDQARSLKIREFTCIVNIISDNQYKGVNLTEKLEAESELLWDQRKKWAQEKGRIAETKLTFPLAILLIVLILVTASPAILQM